MEMQSHSWTPGDPKPVTPAGGQWFNRFMEFILVSHGYLPVT